MADYPDDLHLRLRAARNYEGSNQSEFGTLAGGMTKDRIMLIENKQGLASLTDYQRRSVIAGYSGASGIPEPWFTADWSSITTDESPERRLNNYAVVIGELRKALRESDINGRKDMQDITEALKVLSQRLNSFERILKAATAKQPPPAR